MRPVRFPLWTFRDANIDANIARMSDAPSTTRHVSLRCSECRTPHAAVLHSAGAEVAITCCGLTMRARLQDDGRIRASLEAPGVGRATAIHGAAGDIVSDLRAELDVHAPVAPAPSAGGFAVHEEACAACTGRGRGPGVDAIECVACDGRGRVLVADGAAQSWGALADALSPVGDVEGDVGAVLEALEPVVAAFDRAARTAGEAVASLASSFERAARMMANAMAAAERAAPWRRGRGRDRTVRRFVRLPERKVGEPVPTCVHCGEWTSTGLRFDGPRGSIEAKEHSPPMPMHMTCDGWSRTPAAVFSIDAGLPLEDYLRRASVARSRLEEHRHLVVDGTPTLGGAGFVMHTWSGHVAQSGGASTFVRLAFGTRAAELVEWAPHATTTDVRTYRKMMASKQRAEQLATYMARGYRCRAEPGVLAAHARDVNITGSFSSHGFYPTLGEHAPWRRRTHVLQGDEREARRMRSFATYRDGEQRYLWADEDEGPVRVCDRCSGSQHEPGTRDGDPGGGDPCSECGGRGLVPGERSLTP